MFFKIEEMTPIDSEKGNRAQEEEKKGIDTWTSNPSTIQRLSIRVAECSEIPRIVRHKMEMRCKHTTSRITRHQESDRLRQIQSKGIEHSPNWHSHKICVVVQAPYNRRRTSCGCIWKPCHTTFTFQLPQVNEWQMCVRVVTVPRDLFRWPWLLSREFPWRLAMT